MKRCAICDSTPIEDTMVDQGSPPLSFFVFSEIGREGKPECLCNRCYQEVIEVDYGEE